MGLAEMEQHGKQAFTEAEASSPACVQVQSLRAGSCDVGHVVATSEQQRLQALKEVQRVLRDSGFWGQGLGLLSG